jgi:hypothetical protein
MPLNNNALNGTRNNIAYVGVNAPTPPNTLQVARAPGVQDKKNVYQGDFWLDTTTKSMYVYLGNDSSGNALWELITSATGDVVTLSDTAGTLVTPTGAGNIQIIGDTTSGITVTAGTHTLTIANANNIIGTAQTIGATTATLISVPILANRAVSAVVNIAGARADYSASYAATGNAGYNRQAGALNVLPNVVISPTYTAGIVGTIGANLITSGNNVILQVTGEAGQTWNWSASAEVIVVSA